jgi:hypothetical protein
MTPSERIGTVLGWAFVGALFALAAWLGLEWFA